MGRMKQTARKSLTPLQPQFERVHPDQMVRMERQFHGSAFRASIAFFRTIARARRQYHGIAERRLAFRHTMAATVTYLCRTFRAVTHREPPAMVADMEELLLEDWLDEMEYIFPGSASTADPDILVTETSGTSESDTGDDEPSRKRRRESDRTATTPASSAHRRVTTREAAMDPLVHRSSFANRLCNNYLCCRRSMLVYIVV